MLHTGMAAPAQETINGSTQTTPKTVNDSTETVKEARLGEVTVTADRVVNTVDGLKVFPSARQLQSSTSGYSLLQKLSLPHIRVDEVGKSITAPEQLGSVQVRVNDIIATQEDLTALDMQAVQSIDYIMQPGVRYGEGVGFVINIHTRRAESGYAVGANIMQSLTHRHHSDDVFVKANKGKSEITLSYGFGWRDMRKTRYREAADYHLSDGSIYSVTRNDISRRNETLSHDVSMKYNLADDDKYVFQAVLSGVFSNMPVYNIMRENRSADGSETVSIRQKDKEMTPQLDLYFFTNLPHGQSLTANAVATFSRDRYGYQYGAATPYLYNIDGRTYSLVTEAIYENRLKPFTLSAGIRHENQYADNRYSGDAETDSRMHTADDYLFAQLRGSISRFGYKAGIGVSRTYYSQGGDTYTYWIARPDVTLSYRLTDRLSVRYGFEMSAKAPRPSYLSDVTVRSNEMELSVGNPSLRPTRRLEHTVGMDFSGKRVSSNFHALYRQNFHTYMQQITRTTDDDGNDQFLLSRSNQRSINMVYLSDNTTVRIIPEKLEMTLGGGFMKCFNKGDDYRHTCSFWMYSGNITAYLGRLTLNAYADNGFKFQEGETTNKECGAVYVSASYRLGQWGSVALYWQHPFDSEVTQYRAELLNENLHKDYSIRSGDIGQRLTVRLSINLNHGRKYKSIKKKLNNNGIDTGLIKQGDSK